MFQELRASSPSQFIQTVTEASSSSDISEVYRKGLKRQPDPMIVCVDQNSDKLGGQLVSYQAVKEYLSLLWGTYKKNDQCFIEQKNYTHVRLLFGYGGLDWRNAISMMNNIYRGYWRKVQNFYCPQQKLEMKQCHGSKIVRKMSAPQTPCPRLRPFLTEKKQDDLDSELASIDPILGMKRLRIAVRNIFGYFKNTMERAEWGKLVK